jgi:hypothetical protein
MTRHGHSRERRCNGRPVTHQAQQLEIMSIAGPKKSKTLVRLLLHLRDPGQVWPRMPSMVRVGGARKAASKCHRVATSMLAQYGLAHDALDLLQSTRFHSESAQVQPRVN